MIGPQEIWPIAVIVLVLFGAKRIPELAKGVGQGIREFKKGVRETEDDTEATTKK